MERREENGGLRPARRSAGKNTSADGMETEKIKQDRVAVINSLSSNLPAVLNNPSKGKQRDFFTRTWGEDFNRDPPAATLSDVPARVFEKYLRKLRKYRSTATVGASSSKEQATEGATNSLSAMPRMFWDPGFRLSHPDTFAQVFPFFARAAAAGGQAAASPSRSSRLVQEKLAHHLDLVEVDIAEQVAQKSHHFFEVMTYHDALMTQLVGLNKHVEQLRSRLKFVDHSVYKNSMEICRLERRRRNARLLADKLSVMSHLHQTQPKIQLLLSGNEFSGALDLITTSKDVLSVDLAGIVSFRHLSSQLHEIQSIIGKMLLGDFQTYISEEIHRDVVHVRATVISGEPSQGLTASDSDQLTSVILGLLRQNSFTFLEVLDAASITAVKHIIRDVGLQVLVRDEAAGSGGDGETSGDQVSTLTNLAAEFARTASSQDWTDFLDILLGSLVSLLRRIHAIHAVILAAIENTSNVTVNAVSTVENSTVLLPEQQLKNLQTTSQDVLVNVCDQVVERSSKILTQRSKAGASEHITILELQQVYRFMEILNSETSAMTGKPITGFQLSLQGQSLLFIQSFHDEKRLELSELLEKEKWKKSDMDFASMKEKFISVGCLDELLFGGMSPNGHDEGSSKLNPSSVFMEGEEFCVVGSTQHFLVTLAGYCELGAALPYVSHELGLRAAEILKFYNSKICQLVLGVGAISVSGLKTITIRNLALAKRSLELVTRVIPAVKSQFTNGSNNNNKADTKQFVQAEGHLVNHARELDDKILSVVDSILTQHLTTWSYAGGKGGPGVGGGHQIPSANFKALSKQLSKLHESVSDIWPEADIARLMVGVHERFMASVKAEVGARKLATALAQQDAKQTGQLGEARAFKSELTFYSQSLLRLNVVPEKLLSQEYMDAVWNINT